MIKEYCASWQQTCSIIIEFPHWNKEKSLFYLGAFANLRKATLSFVKSVCSRGKTRLPQQGFSRNFIFDYFSEFFEKIQVSLKSDKNNGLLYMKTCVNLWYYIAEFFFGREMFQNKFVEKIKSHFMFNNFLSKSSTVFYMMWKKHSRARKATDDNIIRRMRVACWIPMATNTPS